MANINLLPWREEQREMRKKRFFYYLVGALTGAVFFAILGYFQIEHLMAYQQQRNQFLNHEISELEDKISHVKRLELQDIRLRNRLDIIQQLQVSRSTVSHLFALLTAATPDGCQLLAVSKRERFVFLEGVSGSSACASIFIQYLDESLLLQETELLALNTNSVGYPGLIWFSLKSKIREVVSVK